MLKGRDGFDDCHVTAKINDSSRSRDERTTQVRIWRIGNSGCDATAFKTPLTQHCVAYN